MNNIRVAPNFVLKEFECKDGSHQVVLYSKLLEKLQKLRDLLKQPVIINSGYRNPEHNKKVGGAPGSLHLKGMAADIVVRSISPARLAEKAREVGFDKVIVYASHVLVEVRQ